MSPHISTKHWHRLVLASIPDGQKGDLILSTWFRQCAGSDRVGALQIYAPQIRHQLVNAYDKARSVAV